MLLLNVNIRAFNSFVKSSKSHSSFPRVLHHSLSPVPKGIASRPEQTNVRQTQKVWKEEERVSSGTDAVERPSLCAGILVGRLRTPPGSQSFQTHSGREKPKDL